MGNIYVGVNGIARKADKIYVGVDGIARQVQKIYVGVDGIAREVYTAFTPAYLTGYAMVKDDKFSCDSGEKSGYYSYGGSYSGTTSSSGDIMISSLSAFATVEDAYCQLLLKNGYTKASVTAYVQNKLSAYHYWDASIVVGGETKQSKSGEYIGAGNDNRITGAYSIPTSGGISVRSKYWDSYSFGCAGDFVRAFISFSK